MRVFRGGPTEPRVAHTAAGTGGAGAAVLLSLALLASPAVAQDPDPAGGQPVAPDTLVLTLDDAIELAREGNPSYRRAENQLALDGPESRATWASELLPSPSVTLLNTGYTGNLTRTARDNFGNPIEDPDSEWSYFSSTNQSLRLDWSIQGRSLLNARGEQRNASEERSIATDAAAWALVSEVRRDFYDVGEQRRLLALEEENLASRRVDHEATLRLFELAVTSRVDVLRAEYEIERQTGEIQRQRRAYEQSLLRLRTTMGVEDLPPVTVAEEPLPVFDPGLLDAEDLVATALDVSPDLRRARTSVEGAEIGLSRARESWWPRLEMNYSLGRSAQEREAAALFDLDHQPAHLGSRFSVALSLPVLNDYFGSRLREAQARVGVDDAHEELRQAELETEETVRSQILELRDAWETLRISRRALAIAEEALELAREEYRIGTLDFRELQDAVEAEADAGRQVVESRYRFVDALVGLEEAVGARVTPTDAGESEGAGWPPGPEASPESEGTPGTGSPAPAGGG